MTDKQTLHNPFPGLRPFEASENHLFFGRDDQSHELLKKLRRNRFVGVVGTSGSGKSSLVRAGLLPALHGGIMTLAGSSWRIAVLRPGHAPIVNMARALDDIKLFGKPRVAGIDQATIIETTLRRGDLGLIETVRQARLPSHENLLVVVDQFEELFRFRHGSRNGTGIDEASAFVALLLEASRNDRIPIYIVLTMRSDFLGDCSQFRQLPETMNDGQYLVPRMTRDQRRLAISGPVAVGGGEITPSLVQQLLNDVGDNPDQLPILQHAMMRTWDHWSRRRRSGDAIDLDDYESIGGMNHALSLHADEAYEELKGNRDKKIAETLFKTLSEKGPDNREVRRPSKLGQICAITGAAEKEVLAVIDTFRAQGRSFLMPPPGVALTPDTLVDVSHESLIRNWSLLKTWVEQESQSAEIYRRLAETAVLYREDKAGHWRDPDLQIALTWREQTQPNESWAHLYHPEFQDAIKFLEASRAARETEQAEIASAQQRELKQAKALAKEQSKAAKRLRITLALLTVLLLAGVLAVFAFRQREIAIRDAATAEKEKAQADSSAAVFATLFTEADSLQKVAATAATSEKGARLEAERQGQLAIAARDSATIERQRAEAQAILAEARRNEAVDARDAALNSQRQVQAVALAINAQRLQQSGNDTLSALLALESYRLDLLSGNQFRNEVYDALRKSLNSLDAGAGGPRILSAPTELLTAMDFDNENSLLAIGGADSTVHLVELQSPHQSRLLGKHRGMVGVVAFAGNGGAVATAGADHIVKIWYPDDPTDEHGLLRGHDNRIASAVFNPDGNTLASGSIDGSVRLWDLQNNSNVELGKHRSGLMSLAFDQDGDWLASAGADSTVMLWQRQEGSGYTIDHTLDFNTIPRTIVFHPKDNLLAVGCDDGTTRLHWLQRNEYITLRGHQKRINRVAFDPGGNGLATASSDKTVRLWDLRHLQVDPIVFAGFASSVRSVAFTATGDTLIAATFGNEIALWLTRPAQLAEQIRAHVRRSLTPAERQQFVGGEGE